MYVRFGISKVKQIILDYSILFCWSTLLVKTQRSRDLYKIMMDGFIIFEYIYLFLSVQDSSSYNLTAGASAENYSEGETYELNYNSFIQGIKNCIIIS